MRRREQVDAFLCTCSYISYRRFLDAQREGGTYGIKKP
jgi:hypothetical protein